MELCSTCEKRPECRSLCKPALAYVCQDQVYNGDNNRPKLLYTGNFSEKELEDTGSTSPEERVQAKQEYIQKYGKKIKVD